MSRSDSSSPPSPASGPHVVLVEPQIPWNTGNVGRTCLATGAQLHLVRPLGFSLEDRYLRRAGLDYWQHLAPQIWPSWSSFETTLPELGEPFLFSAEGELSLWQARFPRDAVLIFGSETTGLAPALRQQHAERLLTIPMQPGPVRSLNLSTSVAVAIYEWRRQATAP
ncbi:MAG: tRNA (cytidine(34)-2'-O)-methyltransferase [Acidobacteriota bacterium]